MTRKPLNGLTVAAVVLLLATSVSRAFFAEIVFDPTNYANALLRHAEMQAQLAQLILEYEHLLRMAELVPVDMSTRYRAPWTPWPPSTPPSDSFGLLGPWTAVVNGEGGALPAYRIATEPLEDFDSLEIYSHPAADRARRAYAGVELADGANLHSMETIGMLRGAAEHSEEVVAALEADALTADPAFHTEVALLDKINAAQVVGLRAQQNANQLLVAVLEQTLAERRAEREAEAARLNAEIGYRRRVRFLHGVHTRGIARSLSSYRLP